VQQKSGFKNLLLEKKLDGVEEEMEKREAYLNELLSLTNLDSSVLEQVRKFNVIFSYLLPWRQTLYEQRPYWKSKFCFT
jgi:hypothetical protein